METYQTAKFDRSPNNLSWDIVLTGGRNKKKKKRKAKTIDLHLHAGLISFLTNTFVISSKTKNVCTVRMTSFKIRRSITVSRLHSPVAYSYQHCDCKPSLHWNNRIEMICIDLSGYWMLTRQIIFARSLTRIIYGHENKRRHATSPRGRLLSTHTYMLVAHSVWKKSRVKHAYYNRP